MGAGRRQLIFQFLLESVIISIIAIILAALFLEIGMELFEYQNWLSYELSFFKSPVLVASLLLTGLFAGLLAGIYPALVLCYSIASQNLKGEIFSENKRKFH